MTMENGEIRCETVRDIHFPKPS